jgi:hypothetical protein
MINSLQFWKDWPKVYQRFFWLSALTFILSFVFLWVSYLRSPAPAITWQYIEEQELQEIPVRSFQLGPFDLTIHADNYLIFERMLGSDLSPNEGAAYLFIVLLALAAVVMLTVITVLSRFWYFAGAGLFILFIASLRLEIIEVFGFLNKTFTIIVLVAYVPVSYFFNAIRPNISFVTRFLTFLFITIALGVIIYLFAGVPLPFLHLSVTGITSGLILTIIFIATVAHEIPAAFISIVSSGQQRSKSLNHFLIISLIYFVNLALAYANKFHFIDWDFLYINVFVLFSLSAVLGVWGFRQRNPQFEGILDIEPFGIYFFLGLGAIAFGTISYFMATVNDPGLEMINDAIIFTHIGFGIIFFTYVISNFLDELGNNLPVARVLYKPARMPYFTFRFAGLIFSLALLFYNKWQVPVNNGYASYYNAAGDLYQTLNNKKLALAFYDKAGTYGFLNHHANYAMANIEASRQNDDKERNFYKRASDIRPTEMSYLNFSQTFHREEKWLDAMLVLNDGAKIFPNSGPIKNTQALIYAKLNLLDSSLYFLQQAKDSPQAGNASRTNLIGLAARHNFNVSPDSLYKMFGSTQDGVRANALAFANLKGEKIKIDIDLERDTTLNLFSATLISNYLINHLGECDSSFITKTISLGERKSNSDFSEALLFSSAMALYADGQVNRAFQQLEKVIFYSSTPGKYNNILALWALEQGDPKSAIGYLNYALSQNYGQALQTTAMATAEMGNPNSSIVMWDSLRRSGDSLQTKISEAMIRVLVATPQEAMKLNDEDKYAYCRYRIKAEDTLQFTRLMSTIVNEDYKARAILDQSKKLYLLDETNAAVLVFQKLKNLKLSDKRVYNELTHLELLMLARQGNFTLLSQQMKNGITFDSDHKAEKIYFNAVQNSNSGDSLQAKKDFNWLSTANPFFDDAIVASANYFRTKGKEKLKPYNILVEALHRHPNSVKITKAYCLEAARVGFDEYKDSALEKLQGMLPEKYFRQFVLQNQSLLSSSSN